MKGERVLISRAALLGDRQAFGRLVEHYQSPVRRFFLKLTLGDGELADDLAQETFIKAWLKIGSFRSLSGFSTWLFRIAYNTFYDFTRRSKSTLESDLDAVAAIADGPAGGADLTMDMEKALSTLTGPQRAAMLLYYMEDKPVADIALIMGCPPGTVKSLLSRGREKVSAFLDGSPYNTERNR